MFKIEIGSEHQQFKVSVCGHCCVPVKVTFVFGNVYFQSFAYYVIITYSIHQITSDNVILASQANAKRIRFHAGA